MVPQSASISECGCFVTDCVVIDPVCVSLDDFYAALDRGEIQAGQAIIFRYLGPKGGPGMPEVRLTQGQPGETLEQLKLLLFGRCWDQPAL